MGSFNFQTVKSFISDEIPRLVRDKRQMTALFATYNAVDGYSNGLVAHGKNGLTIRVQNGDVSYSDKASVAVLVGAFGGPSNSAALRLGMIGCDMMKIEADAAQEKVEQALTVGPSIDDDNVLAVVYAGLSAFGATVDFARSLRRQYPQATLVVLTCDCDLTSKRFELERLMEQGAIHHAIATSECGGRNSMRQLLEALVAAWHGEIHETPTTTAK